MNGPEAGHEDVLKTAAAWKGGGARGRSGDRRFDLGVEPAAGGQPARRGRRRRHAGFGLRRLHRRGGWCGEALDAIADGRPRRLEFGVSDERAWEVGLACGGTVRRVRRARGLNGATGHPRGAGCGACRRAPGGVGDTRGRRRAMARRAGERCVRRCERRAASRRRRRARSARRPTPAGRRTSTAPRYSCTSTTRPLAAAGGRRGAYRPGAGADGGGGRAMRSALSTPAAPSPPQNVSPGRRAVVRLARRGAGGGAAGLAFRCRDPHP